MAYATSKFDIGNSNSPLHSPLKLTQLSKNKQQAKFQFHLTDKVKTLLDILEQ